MQAFFKLYGDSAWLCFLPEDEAMVLKCDEMLSNRVCDLICVNQEKPAGRYNAAISLSWSESEHLLVVFGYGKMNSASFRN